MKNIRLEEITIPEVNELTNVIENILFQCKNVQIFISERLYNQLLNSNKDEIIWGDAVFDSFHYCDNVEKAFMYYLDEDENEKKRILQMHFVKNCSGYVQLTFFATKGTLYRHYLKGMN